MGEYYNWVNVDKKEYICPNDFGFGNKKTESLVRRNAFLCALRELLSKEWKMNHVFFMGDEKQIPEDTANETLRILYSHTADHNYPGAAFDTVCETYKNISGLFRAAEAEVRQEIEFYIDDLKRGYMSANEYGIDTERPFEGLFLRNGQDFRYTINHTKKVCYSFQVTKILHLDGTESDYADPLPLLMGFGRSMSTGPWLGDIIGVADEMPEGYTLLEAIYLDW